MTDAPTAACHGFLLESVLSFTYPRAAVCNLPALSIAEHQGMNSPKGAPLIEWVPRPGNPLRARIHDQDHGYQVWIDGIGTYSIDAAARHIAVPPVPLRDEHTSLASSLPHLIRREEHLWGMPTVLLFSGLARLPLHAAAVELPAGAILLTAPGRHGKTTLAAAFAQAGYRLLAEDLVCVDAGAEPQVLPGPAMLRVRSDAAAAIGPVPSTTEVLRTPQRVHLALDQDIRGTGAPVPLRAIVLLQSDEAIPHDRAELTLMGTADAVRNLWTVSFNLPTDADRTRCFDAVGRLAAAGEVWSMRRRLRYASLPGIVEQLAECFG